MAVAQPQHKSPAPEPLPEEKGAAPQFQDSDPVTVLYGYGKVAPDQKFYVDNHQFVGGVAKNVPYQVAKHWQAGTRPDGQPAVSRVYIQAILPNEADEADYARVTGVRQYMTREKMAALLNSLSANEVLETLGPSRAAELVAKLGSLSAI
jgi:hypothetical protein